MKEVGQYDTDLQMFVEKPLLKMRTLLFHRWQAENNNRALATPSGEFALALTLQTGLPIEKAIDGAFAYSMIQSKEARLRQHLAKDGDY